MEVVMLLLTYLRKYFFRLKKNIAMIIKINEAKTLVRHILCDYIFKLDSVLCNLNQKWNNDKCQC